MSLLWARDIGRLDQGSGDREKWMDLLLCMVIDLPFIYEVKLIGLSADLDMTG